MKTKQPLFLCEENNFFQGGWSFLDPDSDEENQADADEDDSEDDGAYAPSDEELGSEEESEDYSGESEISDSEYSDGNVMVFSVSRVVMYTSCTQAEKGQKQLLAACVPLFLVVLDLSSLKAGVILSID